MLETTTERLFFALWPAQTLQATFHHLGQQLSSEVTGRLIQQDNLHITLAFIGNVSPATKSCLQQAATTIKAFSFTLHLDKVGYWAKPRIVWLGTSQLPNVLLHLVTQLNTKLYPCGYQPETRPYQAHITLFRRATLLRKIPTIQPLVWPVNDFCLVRSVTSQKGVHYEVIERWNLLSV